MSKDELSRNERMLAWRLYWPPLMTIALLTLLALLSACSTTVTRLTIPPAKCSKHVAADAWKAVQGVDVSTAETQRDWAAAFVGQTGRLETANRDKDYIRETMTACEDREQEIYDALHGKKRRFFGVF
jgi:hypothetical protein